MKDSAPTAVPKKKKTTRRKRRPKEPTPTLRFSPFAWAKLLFLRDLGDTEVGGFGISNADDPLLVEDVRLIGQYTTVVSVEFDDEAVADFFDEQVDAGLKVERWFRLWLHTHPGDSAEPSATDEETFERVFGRCDWAVMAILAKGGQTYARIRFKAGPGGQIEIPVEVDYSASFAGVDHAAWESEYEQNVDPIEAWRVPPFADELIDLQSEPSDWDAWNFSNEREIDDAEYESVLAAERPRAARETEEPDGNGHRRRGDRKTGRVAAGGTRCATTATD